jgi:hypothetical protein
MVMPDFGDKSCPNGTLFVNPWRFGVVARSALFNRITVERIVMQNNVETRAPIPDFDGSDPNNGNRTTVIRESLDSDQNAGWIRTRFVFVSPIAGWTAPDDRTIKLVLVEHSNNAKFKGTPQETAERPVNAVVVKSVRNASCPEKVVSTVGAGPGCEIALFEAPGTILSGEEAHIAWRVVNCVKAQLREGQSVSQEKTSTSGPATLEGELSIQLQQNTIFELRGFGQGATAPSVSKTHTILTSPVVCPAGGARQPFTFCVKCPGSTGTFDRTVTYNACSEADGKTEAQADFANCTVTAGACP